MKSDYKFDLKINQSGSWLSAGRYSFSDIDRVKTACMTLAECHIGRIRFKITTCVGNIIVLCHLERNSADEPVVHGT